MTDSGTTPNEPQQIPQSSPSDHIEAVPPETPVPEATAPQQPTEQPEWYYAVSGQSFGPVTKPQLAALAKARYFGPEDFVYAAYLGNWVKAGSVHGLFDSVEPFLGGTGVVPPLHVPGRQAPFGPELRDVEFAGFWIRWLADFIDGFVVAFPLCIVIVLVTALLTRAGLGLDEPIPLWERDFATLLVFALAYVGVPITMKWVYCALLESSKWQATLGKRAVGIIVTDIYGGRVSFARASSRYFASLVSAMILMIGYLIQPLTERRQTLHDIIARTVVLHGRT